MLDTFIDKRVKYDVAFRAEALRLANQSRSYAAAARALNIRVKLLYKWRDAAQSSATVADSNLDSTTVAELHRLRAISLRQAQELEILKKAIVIFSTPPTL